MTKSEHWTECADGMTTAQRRKATIVAQDVLRWLRGKRLNVRAGYTFMKIQVLALGLGLVVGAAAWVWADIPPNPVPRSSAAHALPEPKAKALPPWAQSLLAPRDQYPLSERSELLGYIVTVQPKAGVCTIRTRSMQAVATFTCRSAVEVRR